MKRPKQAPVSPRTGKPREVRTVIGSSDHERICWQFCSMDRNGPFGWEGVDLATWRDILGKLRDVESRTWGEIKGDRDHAIPVDRLSSPAVRRLREIGMDDIDDLFSLHLGGKPRIFGVRDRHVFRVLWWDPNHKVCPSELKHT